MRYVPLLQQAGPTKLNGEINTEWLEKSDDLLKQMELAGDHAARERIIRANQKHWSELKTWLESLNHQKCWFSDTKDKFSYYEVEHFRPKSKLRRKKRSPKEDGYWWLAFAWRNFRVCGKVGNIKKGIFFPLQPNSPISKYKGLSTDNELNTILDPVCKSDTELVSFDETGSLVAVSDATSYETSRVEETVRLLHLDYPKLVEARKHTWSRCWDLIKECREIAKEEIGPSEQSRIDDKKHELRRMVAPNEELSEVARACLLKSNIGWAINLAATSN